MLCRALIEREAIEVYEGPPPVILGEADFRPYQRWMADQALITPFILMAAEMGLGKTGAALLVARKRLDAGLVRRVLIVAPVKVCNNTWPEELAKWEFARSLSYSILTGDEENRLAGMREETQIHIVNRENLVWLFRQLGRRWPYDMLIYDEASRLKGASPKTTPTARTDGTMSTPKLSEFGTLKRTRMYFKYIIEMSGTPSPNGLRDLWGPIYILDRGERLGDSKTAFLNRWFAYNKYNFTYTPHDHSEAEIMAKIADIMVSLREEDYLSLPPFVDIPRYVTLDKKVMDKYKQFERDMLLEEYDVEAVNNGVLTNKLLQFANGSIYDDEGNDRWVHNHKLDELENIVVEANGESMMVAYSFQFDLRAIKKRFPKAVIYDDAPKTKRDWDRGRIPMLLIHPASAGHGLNFQSGGHISVWYGLNWSLELFLQFNKRLHRSGQKAERVFQYRILARGTEDENQLQNLMAKRATQDSITEWVRVRYQDILDQQRLI